MSAGSGTARPASGAKRPALVIKPFSRRPAAPQDIFEEHWSHLRAAVADIHAERPTARGTELLYRSVEDLQVHGSGARLYTSLSAVMRERAVQVAQALCADTTAGDDADFLSRADAAWRAYARHTSMIASVFIYLDRTYVIRNPEAKTIWDTGVALFREHVASVDEVKRRTVAGFIALVGCERRGEAIDRALLQSFSSMLAQTGLYAKVLEPQVVEATRSFYAEEGERLVSELEVPAYLELAARRLDQELDRCGAYLLPTTRRSLLGTVESELVTRHVATIIQRGFDPLIAAGEARLADLATMYRLLARVGRLGDLKSALSNYVRTAGAAIVGDPERDGEMVASLIAFRGSLERALHGAFASNEQFRNALRESFEHFVNTRQNRPAELIAKFLDQRLRTGRASPGTGGADSIMGGGGVDVGGSNGGGNSLALTSSTSSSSSSSSSALGSGADGLERDLDEAMALFRFVRGKDVFEAFYKKDLAKRLLLGKSASVDAEKTMISKLKQECGSAFTSKLEGMFRDIDVSRDFMLQYSQTPTSKRVSEATGVDLSVHVLTMGYWPTHVPVEIKLPDAVAKLQEAFKEAYTSKHSGRRLSWWHAQCHCVVRATFPSGTKELVLSAFQAIVLLLFSDPSSGPIGYTAIREATGLEDAELKRTLQSLACAKVQPLRKDPRGREVNDTDTFSFNEKFSNRLYRIKINTIQMKETKEEHKSTTESVFQDRHYAIDAAIVRIMKTRKTLPHVQLMAQLIEILRFPTTPADLKARIESLIDREYLERDKTNSAVYNYLA